MSYEHIAELIREATVQSGRKPEEVKWVAVSKGQSVEAIQAVYRQGGREFGENRAVEMCTKMALLPEDCHWHFLGRLQKNKVAKVLGCNLIHSVDTWELAEKIHLMSAARGKVTSVLLQLNLLRDPAKQGFSLDQVELLREKLFSLTHLRIEGVMTIAPQTENREEVRHCFRQTTHFLQRWQKMPGVPSYFREISMGMSQDFRIAIEEGATWLRIGSLLFQRPFR